MSFPDDQLQEMKQFTPELAIGSEGGNHFVLIPKVCLPGWSPGEVDLLLCPHARDGYASRLFLSAKVSGRPGLNWNSEARILDRNWFAFSFRVPHANLRLAQLFAAHLRALR